LNNDQEQTWPTTEELEKAQTERHQLKKRVPKGTSEYQAAWIVSDDEQENSETDEKVEIKIFRIEFLKFYF
jgi:pre-rRNA-processing protein TSR1